MKYDKWNLSISLPACALGDFILSPRAQFLPFYVPHADNA